MNWVSIGAGNGLAPVRRQATTRTNADSVSIRLKGTTFSEIRIGIFVHENAYEIVVCENEGHFVRGRDEMKVVISGSL